MEKLDYFYEKINGYYFGIIAFLINLFSITIAQVLYIEAEPNFSMCSNFISDLGAGPNRSDIFFNIGLIFTGISIMPFFVYIGWYLQKRQTSNSIIIGMIAGLIGSIGMILVGIFPLAG